MDELFFIISRSVNCFLNAITALMLIRAVMSLFIEEETPFYTFCCVTTEPIVAPVRGFLSRIPSLNEFPVDISFMATYLIISIVQLALPYS